MPLKEIEYKEKLYLIITPSKVHEGTYRRELSATLIENFGNPIQENDNLEALKLAFDFYAEKLTHFIRSIDDLSLIVFVHQLHEQTAELSYLTQEDFDLPIDYKYYCVYRRVLKLILQESTHLSFEKGKEINPSWMNDNILQVEEMIYLGELLIDITDAISEVLAIGNFIRITFHNGLFILGHEEGWGGMIDTFNNEIREDMRLSLINEEISDDFEINLQEKLGFGLGNIEQTLASLNNHFHNKNPPEIYNFQSILKIMGRDDNTVQEFIKGLILTKDNVTSISDTVNKPYAGNNRIFNRPILTVNLEGEEHYLVEEYSFGESKNNFFQNNLSFGKIPHEWKNIPEIVALKNKYESVHKDLLENGVEELLKANAILYDGNVKRLRKFNKQDLSINDIPGEIDFIFVLNDIIYIADCKNLTKRFEMRGFSEDISKFTKDYNLKMEKKLKFMIENKPLLNEHFQVIADNPNLNLIDFAIQGIFIVNTGTIYTMNAPYKIYTYRNFEKLLNGDDFTQKYFGWSDGERFGKITYPFIDSFKAVLTNLVD